MSSYKEVSGVYSVNDDWSVRTFPVKYKGLISCYRKIKKIEGDEEDKDSGIAILAKKILKLFYKFTDFIEDTTYLEDEIDDVLKIVERLQHSYKNKTTEILKVIEVLMNVINEPEID